MMSQFLNSKHLKVLLLSSLVLIAGCAKESGGGGSTANPPVDGTIPPVVPGSIDSHPLANLTTGATIDFQFDSVATLNNYVQMRPLNDPQNMKMNVELRKRQFKSGSTTIDSFEGRIYLGYFDTGNYYIATFESGYGVNGVQNPDSPSTYQKPESQFNRWFNGTVNGNNVVVFHGFFQDRYGAIMLVIDGGVDSGDGSGYTQVNGSVYYLNFPVGYASQSPEKCWFISIGPFDCRTFVTSKQVQTTSAVYPFGVSPRTPVTQERHSMGGFWSWLYGGYYNSYSGGYNSPGYQRLGTFQGLDKIKAFGN